MTTQQSLIYAPEADWTPERYKRLLDASLHYCTAFTVCSTAQLSEVGQQVLEKLSGHSIYQRCSSKWPGTQHLGENPPFVHKYELSKSTASILERTAETPWDWCLPELPEDLAFLRSDGRPWFISICHEGFSYFKLTHDEGSKLETELGISLSSLGEDQSTDERF